MERAATASFWITPSGVRQSPASPQAGALPGRSTRRRHQPHLDTHELLENEWLVAPLSCEPLKLLDVMHLGDEISTMAVAALDHERESQRRDRPIQSSHVSPRMEAPGARPGKTSLCHALCHEHAILTGR